MEEASTCVLGMSRRLQCFVFLLSVNIGIMGIWYYQNSGDVSFLLAYGHGIRNGTFLKGGVKQHLTKMKKWFNFTKETGRKAKHPYPVAWANHTQDVADSSVRYRSYIGIPNNFDIPAKPNLNKTHTILIYNRQTWMDLKTHNRLVTKCYYNNCRLTTDKTFIHKASAIIFHYFYMGMGVKQPPIPRDKRNPDQAWVFMGRESPINSRVDDFSSGAWLNTLNWSMTYRREADIFSAYGRLTKRLKPPEKDYDAIFNSKSKMAVWMVNKCKVQSAREKFVAELKKYGVDVDIYGKCGKGSLARDKTDEVISQYKFYLSLENTFCNDYITEKFFARYNNNYILVARGGADYDKRLPNSTFINTAHFKSIKALADYMKALSRDKREYIEMLKRKDQYESNGPEFGWHYAWCELCDKINNLDQNRNTYKDAGAFIKDGQCWNPTDVSPYKEIKLPDIIKVP